MQAPGIVLTNAEEEMHWRELLHWSLNLQCKQKGNFFLNLMKHMLQGNISLSWECLQIGDVLQLGGDFTVDPAQFKINNLLLCPPH